MRNRSRCTYCGRTVRTGRIKGRHAIYPLTCGACSDLPAADPTYATARSLVDPAHEARSFEPAVVEFVATLDAKPTQREDAPNGRMV